MSAAVVIDRSRWCDVHAAVLFDEPPYHPDVVAAIVAAMLSDPRVSGFDVSDVVKLFGCPACFVNPADVAAQLVSMESVR